MDILMSETCWAHKKWNKIASDIKLIFCFQLSTILLVYSNYNGWNDVCCITVLYVTNRKITYLQCACVSWAMIGCCFSWIAQDWDSTCSSFFEIYLGPLGVKSIGRPRVCKQIQPYKRTQNQVITTLLYVCVHIIIGLALFWLCSCDVAGWRVAHLFLLVCVFE